MFRNVIIVFLLSISYSCWGQFGLNHGENAKSLALGGASVNFNGIESIFSNQAGMTSIKNLSVIAHAERRFDINDLSTFNFGLIKSTGFGHFGLMISSFGIDAYQEQKIGLAYGRKLFDKLSIGGQFDLLSLNIDQFGSKSVFTFELGLQSQVTKELTVSAHIFSPGNVSITDNDELSSRMRFGLTYKAGDKARIFAEFQKVLEFENDMRFGIEYDIIEALSLRIGTSVNPGSVSGGFSYKVTKNLLIDGGYANNSVLGATPGVSIKYISF